MKLPVGTAIISGHDGQSRNALPGGSSDDGASAALSTACSLGASAGVVP